jgi:hypothetical protein
VVIVFAIAIVLRVPSCYESFWVDELHSAWTVWGEFKDVFPRAKIGNQAPYYFVGLWFWKQAVGESEIALRMSSVLATACAASLLTWGIARWTKSITAGVAAGLVVAAETNAIFFGTELRPYAFVILGSSIAVLCFMQLMVREASATGNPPWIVLVLVSLVAALCQPTSLGVLAWIFVGLAVHNITKNGVQPKISIINVLLGTAVLGVAWMLWQTTLSATWQARSNWASFGRAPSWHHIASLWNWIWLWLIPLLLVFAPCGRWLSNEYSRQIRLAIAIIAGVCLVATFSYWSASRMDWVHLWHRRYAVALLPMFAALVGVAVGRFQISNFRFQIPAFAIAGVILLGLTYSQGVLQTAIKNPLLLAYRGEDWRGAIRWIDQHTTTSDLLLLDSGLIEAKIWHPRYPSAWHPSDLRERYLLLPALGPYQTQPFHAIDDAVESLRYVGSRRKQHPFDFQLFPSRRRYVVILSRYPVSDPKVTSIRQFHSSQIVDGSIEIHGFGGVSVVRIQLANDE